MNNHSIIKDIIIKKYKLKDILNYNRDANDIKSINSIEHFRDNLYRVHYTLDSGISRMAAVREDEYKKRLRNYNLKELLDE